MPERHLLPIPLPHGRSGDRGFLTVYFSPRLRERGPLSDYPEWEHWADTVNALAISVVINGVAQVPTRVTPLAEPAVWDAVFAADTPLSGHRPKDWRSAPVQIGPGGDFSEAILALYAAFATSYPDGPPPGDEALKLPEASVLTAAGADAAHDYVAPMDDKQAPLLDEPRDPEWDFHAYISILGHHPHLLRLLGIAVELEVDLPANPTNVRVHTSYDNGLDRRALDFAMATTPGFRAQPNPDAKFTEQVDGFLRLAEQHAFLSILDLQSTADRLRDLDERLPGHIGTLPALRTRALTLVQPDLVAAFRNRTERQWAIEEDIEDALNAVQPQPVAIFAEDVTIGHRIDVFETSKTGSGDWHSLFDRQTDDPGYHFPTDPALDRIPAPDEGWTTTNLVTEQVERFEEPDPDVDDAFVPFALRRLDDQLYRWDGWSGAVRPPGSAADGATGRVAPAAPTVPPVGDPVQFSTHYDVVPASLPRLRFGREYLMRARCVDLAGDSRPLDAPVPPEALPPAGTFGRLEPIAAPSVVRRLTRPVPGVGDDPLTIVLRSDYDVNDADVRPQERLLFPGRVGQDLCELHGQPAGGADAASYGVLARLDARQPHDPWDRDPVTGEPIAGGRRRQQVRYLSDPLVGRLRAVRLGERSEHLATINGAWPATDVARIEVVAGDQPTTANPDDVTDLRIGLAKADISSVELSYAMTEGGVEQFGLWHRLAPTVQAALRPVIDNGGHWMFSARVPAQLVHAVRRPLLAPRFAPASGDDPTALWSATREEHSTGVTISATVEIDRRSTERLTMAAHWIDLVDDVRRPGPQARPGGAPLGRFLTPRDTESEPRFGIVGHRAELGDTRRHAASIDLEAFSSFSAYFTEERAVTLANEPVVVDARGFAGGTVAVRTDEVTATQGHDFTADNGNGTIALRLGGRLRAGDEVTVRYVPLPVSRTNGVEEGFEPFEVVFPSTAAPPPPTVLDVVSAFARVRTELDGGTDVLHEGGVVRLYFARPWNVSGDRECLAVLVEKAPSALPTASCVGRDPIVTGTTEPFTASALTRSFALVESFDGTHDLALHTVAYDGRSQRWFADIALHTPMYRPFLRLVVARYQADSLPGLDLSGAVTLESIRLGVSRTVIVRPVEDEPDTFDVTVTGPDHAGMDADDGTAALLVNEFVVIHQRADTAIPDDDLRWQVEVSTVTLTRTVSGGLSTWSGRIEAPTDGTPRRLVIEEREPALVGGAVPTISGEVIYTDTVSLDP